MLMKMVVVALVSGIVGAFIGSLLTANEAGKRVQKEMELRVELNNEYEAYRKSVIEAKEQEIEANENELEYAGEIDISPEDDNDLRIVDPDEISSNDEVVYYSVDCDDPNVILDEDGIPLKDEAYVRRILKVVDEAREQNYVNPYIFDPVNERYMDIRI